MPRLVTELAQGNKFSRSSEGGTATDTATRVFKVVLNEPNEDWNVFTAIGYNIGDVYSQADPIPLVSVDAQADGSSRLVRIVTANFRSTPGPSVAGGGGGGGGGSGAADPRTYAPTARPANFTMSTATTQVAVRKVFVHNSQNNTWTLKPLVNSAGDLIDGIVRQVPVTTVVAWVYTENAGIPSSVGAVNSTSFQLWGETQGMHKWMLESIEYEPHIENFGTELFRGFKKTYRLSYNPMTWETEVIDEGFNCLQSGLGRADVDEEALSLEHELNKVKMPLQLAAGVAGTKKRALVGIPSMDGGWLQRPSASPVALNLDGTPRKLDGGREPLTVRVVTAATRIDFGDDFEALGITLT